MPAPLGPRSARGHVHHPPIVAIHDPWPHQHWQSQWHPREIMLPSGQPKPMAAPPTQIREKPVLERGDAAGQDGGRCLDRDTAPSRGPRP
ncbi:MAG: hypothetical protein WD468_00365 [Pirellulales bacterium]